MKISEFLSTYFGYDFLQLKITKLVSNFSRNSAKNFDFCRKTFGGKDNFKQFF